MKEDRGVKMCVLRLKLMCYCVFGRERVWLVGSRGRRIFAQGDDRVMGGLCVELMPWSLDSQNIVLEKCGLRDSEAMTSFLARWTFNDLEGGWRYSMYRTWRKADMSIRVFSVWWEFPQDHRGYVTAWWVATSRRNVIGSAEGMSVVVS